MMESFNCNGTSTALFIGVTRLMADG